MKLIKLLKKIFQLILSRYAPGAIKSILFLCGALVYKYGCDCTIGWFYSEYNQIKKATY